MTDKCCNHWAGQYCDWCWGELDGRSIQHVFPQFGRDHITDQGDFCWCDPKVEFVEGGAIVIHEAEQ